MTEILHTPDQSGAAAALPKPYTQHPLSAAFPPMTPEDFQELKDSIDNIGVQNAITVLDGMVLDGWNRYRACLELGMPCPEVVGIADFIDPRDFVMAQNQARRHVSKAQMAMAVTAVYEWKPVGANQHDNRVGTECPPSQSDTERLNVEAPKTTAELSEISGVGERTIKQAKTVTNQAAPAVVDAVKRGQLGLPKAVQIAKLPPDQQAAAISKPLQRPPTVVVPPANWTPRPVLARMDDIPEGAGDPSEAEIADALAAEQVDIELMEKILAADNVAAELAAEVKKLKAQLSGIISRFDGLMGEKNEAIKLVKSRDWQIKQLYKELDLYKKGGTQ